MFSDSVSATKHELKILLYCDLIVLEKYYPTNTASIELLSYELALRITPLVFQFFSLVSGSGYQTPANPLSSDVSLNRMPHAFSISPNLNYLFLYY